MPIELVAFKKRKELGKPIQIFVFVQYDMRDLKCIMLGKERAGEEEEENAKE